MKIKKLTCFAFCFAAMGLAAFAKDKCLIITGQNNHNWASTTPVLKTLAELAGDFDVVVNESPENMAADTLKGVKVIVSNWNALGPKKWSEEAFEAYEDFVNQGGGVVSVHACTTYPNAPESYKKIGIGTWTGKTFHGPYSSFQVKIQSSEHPVMKGVGDFVTRDELWSNVEFTGDYEVLASAIASGRFYVDRILGKDAKQNSVPQPSVVATTIGKGKCVTIFLGHDVIAMGKPEFMDIFANALLWTSGGEVEGGLINESNLDKVTLEISKQIENGNMSLVNALDNFALNSDAKVRSKVVDSLLKNVVSNSDAAPYFKRRAWYLIANIAGKQDIAKISKYLGNKDCAELARAAVKRVNFALQTQRPAVIEFKVADSAALKKMLANYGKLSDDEKIKALAQFYFAAFKPALPKAREEVKNPNREIALNALRVLSKLATTDDYPFFATLLKETSDQGCKRAILESAMCIENANFDVLKALKAASPADVELYANIALVKDAKTAINAILSGEMPSYETLNLMLPYADESNIASILSLFGKSNQGDSALNRALVNYMRQGGQNFELVKSVFDSLNSAAKAKVLQALAVCANPQMFDFVLNLANSSDKASSEAATSAIMNWRSSEPIMKIAAMEKVGGASSVEVLYSILNKNRNTVLKPGEIVTLSKIFSVQKDPKYADLTKRLGEVCASAKPRGNKNLAKGAKAESVYKYGPDGNGGLPPAAIDCDSRTYWDEVDGKGLYGLRITLPKKEKISQMRILRYNEVWSPDGFEVFVDGKSVKKVGYAVYENNRFNLDLNAEGSVLEIKIDNVPGCKSPAMRELELY